MNTIMIGSDDFQKPFRPCALDESSLSIGRVNCHLSRHLTLDRTVILRPVIVHIFVAMVIQNIVCYMGNQ